MGLVVNILVSSSMVCVIASVVPLFASIAALDMNKRIDNAVLDDDYNEAKGELQNHLFHKGGGIDVLCCLQTGIEKGIG